MKMLSNQRNLFTQELSGKRMKETVLNSKGGFSKHIVLERLQKKIKCNIKLAQLFEGGLTH